MKRPSKGSIVVSVAVVGSDDGVASGFALKQPLLEQWYLWQLQSEDEETQKAAAERLGKMQSVKGVPKLLQVLRDYEEPKSPRPFNGVNLFPNGLQNMPYIFVQEMTEEYWQEFWPGRALAAIGCQAIPHVAEWIQDEGWQFRKNSIMDAGLRKAMQKMGPAAAPYLVEILSDDNPNTRRVAVLTLTLGIVAKGSNHPKIISALVNGLSDSSYRIRFLCVWAIGRIRPVTENALSALRAAESDEHELVRVAAAEVLKKTQAE